MLKKIFTFLLGSFIISNAYAQIQVSDTLIDWYAVENGQSPPSQKVIILDLLGGNIGWTASIVCSPNYLVTIDGAITSGTTPDTLSLTSPCWAINTLAPGLYTGTITFIKNSSTDTAKILVRVHIVAKDPDPAFSYLAGPNFATQQAGYIDADLTTIPNEAPPGNFTPPTAGGSYIDPNFGGNVTILCDPTGMNNYATIDALSAHNKYAYAGQYTGNTKVISLTNYSATPVNLPGQAGQMWDANNDSIFYYFSYSLPCIIKYNFLTHKLDTIMDYSGPPYNFTTITNGGTGDLTKDNWITFYAENEHTLCVYDINRNKTYMADYLPDEGNLPITVLDYPMLTKGWDAVNGKRYVLLMASPSFMAYSVDTINNKLNFEFRGPEFPEGMGNHNGICEPGEWCMATPHGDTFEDNQGNQYFITSYDTQCPGSERQIMMFLLRKETQMTAPDELGGGRRKVMTLYNTVPWIGDHYSGARNAPYFAISTDFTTVDTTTNSSPNCAHRGEVMVMSVINGNITVRRLCHHRSVGYPGDATYFYSSQAKGSISADGSAVVYTSNFGEPLSNNGLRMAMVETGYSSGTTSIDAIKNETAELSVFPNPATNKFRVQLNNAFGKGELNIVSIEGKIVYSKHLDITTGQYSESIETNDFAKGFYIIKYSGAAKNLTAKIIIQ